jgi:hypothetical protein
MPRTEGVDNPVVRNGGHHEAPRDFVVVLLVLAVHAAVSGLSSPRWSCGRTEEESESVGALDDACLWDDIW